MFFFLFYMSALDYSALPEKRWDFFPPRARIGLLPISERAQLISGAKKRSEKKVYFRR